MQTQAISNTSALQALEALATSLQSGAGASGFSPVSAGQSVPTGAASPSGSTPSSQFDSGALSFLTSLQDIASGAASTAVTAAMGATPMGMAAGIGLSDLTSMLGQLGQSLNGSSFTSSASSTSSTGVSSLSTATTSAIVQSLDQLNATLQSLQDSDGTPRHHHHHGGADAAATSQTSAQTGSSGTATLSVSAGSLSALA